jgi:hypothetical protein
MASELRHFGRDFAHQSVFAHKPVVGVSDMPFMGDGFVRKDEFVRNVAHRK